MPYLEAPRAGCACRSTRPGRSTASGKSSVSRAGPSSATMRPPRTATAPGPSRPVAGQTTRPARTRRSAGLGAPASGAWEGPEEAPWGPSQAPLACLASALELMHQLFYHHRLAQDPRAAPGADLPREFDDHLID